MCLWLLITMFSQKLINQVNITFSSEELGQENSQKSSVSRKSDAQRDTVASWILLGAK